MASKSKAKGSRFEYAIRDMLNRMYDSKEFARTLYRCTRDFG